MQRAPLLWFTFATSSHISRLLLDHRLPIIRSPAAFMLALHHMKAALETPLKLRPKGLTVYFGCVAILLAVVTGLILAVLWRAPAGRQTIRCRNSVFEWLSGNPAAPCPS